MKIEITLRTAESATTYVAEYDDETGLAASDLDKYDALRINKDLIGKAVDDADENDTGVRPIVLTGESGDCTIRLWVQNELNQNGEKSENIKMV